MLEITDVSSPVGSEIFAGIALLVLSLIVLLILRHYLPLRTTPAYLLVPIFFALFLPASIVLLVPIDLASSAREKDVGSSRGIWLPEPVLFVAWRICYWLTFALTWFILPILAEYADAGYRDPKGRLLFSLRANAQYQALILGASIAGGIYVFIYAGWSFHSAKILVMALAYCWGLILAIYLMGHGLVAIPRRLFRNASISGRLRRIQGSAAKVHEKMEDAILNLEDFEAQVSELTRRQTGSAKGFKDWIDELADESHLPESRPRISRRLSSPQTNLPNVITERYLADLSRQLTRARHSRARYLDEWDHLLYEAVEVQAILDSAASKKIDIGQVSPHSSILDRFTILTPYTRYLYKYYVVPYTRILFGCILSLASICIIWSEFIKSINPVFSVISLTVIHHPDSERGEIGFAGQVIASLWILYMCAAALYSLTEVKVWRGRALVRRNTHGESAMWYALQVAKLSVPLSYNFLTFISPLIINDTVFYKFLGKLIVFTSLGAWFDTLFPVFILVPVCATLFNLYGKVKNCTGFGGVIDEEDDDENGSAYGTLSWREGRDLIERELQGHSSLGRLGDNSADGRRPNVPNNPNNRTAPTLSVPPAKRHRSLGQPSASRPTVDPQQRREDDPEDENFFEAFGHRVKNTVDTFQKPKWLQNVGEGIKKPKWMGGDDDSGSGEPSRSGSDFTKWFGGRQEGRVRL